MEQKVNQNLALAEFEKKQQKRILTGKVIVSAIVLYDILSYIVALIVVSFEYHALGFFVCLILFLIELAFDVALYRGVTWVRYFTAAGSIIVALERLFALCSGSLDFSSSVAPALLTARSVFQILFALATGLLLFFSKSVSEFLYAQK